MRVIFAGGGTGGQRLRGRAVARELQQRDSITEILFVGTAQGIEARVIPQERFRLETIPVRGLKGRGVRGLLDAVWGIPAGLLHSLKIIRNFRPDIIIGLGGYASGPDLFAGKLRGLRCVIMEQNLQPGFTNKFLARFVDRVFTSYRESSAHFSGGKVLETGNPVRWSKLPAVARSEKFVLLVFGGSAGAHHINLAVVDAMKRLMDLGGGLQVIQQTGQADFTAIKKAYGALPFEAEVLPFIEKMDEAYAH